MRKILFLIILITISLFDFSLNCFATAEFICPVSISPKTPNAGDKVMIKCKLSMMGSDDSIIVIGGIDLESLFRKEYTPQISPLTDNLQFTWAARAGSHKAWFRIVNKNDLNGQSKPLDFDELVFVVPGGINSIPWTDVSSSTALKSLTTEYHLTGESHEKKPDLLFADPFDRYLVAYMGEKISIPITVENSGSLNAPSSIIAVKCNERGLESVQTIIVPPISAGDKVILKAEYIPQSQWDILCDVFIDPDSNITELNEYNNNNRFTLQILTKSLPDLTPTIKHSIIRSNEMRWRVTVTNTGDVESEPVEYSTLIICKNGDSEAEQPTAQPVLQMLPRIAPGKTFIFNGSSPLDGEICAFSVIIDPLGKLKEKDENNNSAEIKIRLK